MLIILLFSIFYLIRCPIAANRQQLNQCYPKFNNYTLCAGPAILNSVNTFSGLLRNSKSGYSIYQSNLWIILLHTKCHADLEKLLCSIYAPVCLKGHHFTRIMPCAELCDSVREKCLPRLKIYGFEWPSMVNCVKFPLENESNCIQLTDKTENRSIQSKVKRQREDRSLNQTILSDEEKCQVCNRKATMRILAKKFCSYSLVIKAKIANIFQKPKGAISIRLQHRSKILYSSKSNKFSLASLMTEVQCNCPLLQNSMKSNRGKWLLFGDYENDLFIVKFLTKWRKKRKKFRILFRELKSKRNFYCKNQRKLLETVETKAKNSDENKMAKNNVRKESVDSNDDRSWIYSRDLYNWRSNKAS